MIRRSCGAEYMGQLSIDVIQAMTFPSFELQAGFQGLDDACNTRPKKERRDVCFPHQPFPFRVAHSRCSLTRHSIKHRTCIVHTWFLFYYFGFENFKMPGEQIPVSNPPPPPPLRVSQTRFWS